MKRILKVFSFIFFLLFLSGKGLRAEFGIGVGTALSFVGERSEIYNGSTLVVAKAGLFYSFPIAKTLSLRPGIYLALKGGRYYDSNQRAYDRVSLNYIEIPVLLCLGILNEKLEFSVGPYIGFLVGSTENNDEHRWTWRENEIRDTDIGVSIGAGYHLMKWLFIEVQFNNGLTKVVYDPNPVAQSYSKGHRNRTLSLLAVLNF